MKLFFDKITKKPEHHPVSDAGWFPFDDGVSTGDVTAAVTVSRRGRETVIVKGVLEGRRNVGCDRCGKQISQILSSKFEYLVTTREEEVSSLHDVECSKEDSFTIYLKEPEINIDEILQEQALLAVPLRTLCSEDCKGLCPGCGVVLNNDICRCSSDNSKSPFAVLGKLCNH
jgi:uncharacterized protein